MKRREALEKTSLILKAAIFAPGVLSALQACQQKVPDTKNLLVLTSKQDDLLVAIADTIIPRTDTVSASDVKVNIFIDLLLQDVFEENVKLSFLNGLDEFDKECQAIMGNSFIKLNEEERYEYLEKVDREVMGKKYGEMIPFYYTFKQLTLNAYFSSEQGVKQNLDYIPIPGEYQAEVDFKEGDKIMVGNYM